MQRRRCRGRRRDASQLRTTGQRDDGAVDGQHGDDRRPDVAAPAPAALEEVQVRPGSDEEEYVPPSSHEGASHVARWILDRFERVGLAHFGVAPSTSTDERPPQGEGPGGQGVLGDAVLRPLDDVMGGRRVVRRAPQWLLKRSGRHREMSGRCEGAVLRTSFGASL